MVITVIGLGLIGGSAAIDLRKRGFANTILGVDNDKINANGALSIGLVDEICTLEEGIGRSDMIIVAVPADAAVNLLPKVLDLAEGKVVTDVCSTKGRICEIIKYHKNRRCYVASHPMAGTEFSGPWAAMSGLFDGKSAILCDTEESDIKAVAKVKRMYDTLNMRIIYMNSTNHDVHAAYISHISHISSFALALTVLEKERNEKHIFDLASGGFDSTVRLAKSSPDMWVPIFHQNKDNVVTVLETYIEKLQKFRALIKEDEDEKIRDLIKESNRIKAVLKH
jgi:prephenate dehydrogenase